MRKWVIRVENRQGESLYVSSLSGSMGFQVKVKAKAKRFASPEDARKASDAFRPVGYALFFIEPE